MKPELSQAEVDAIVLPHKGARTARNTYKRRATYFSNGPRGRACCVHVFSGDRSDVGGHRCGKIASVTETVEGLGDLDFCAFHSSAQEATRAARQAARDEEQRARWALAAEARNLARLAPVFRDALTKIAEGDNDPRRVARIALGLQVEEAGA